ncbi:MAG TPA: archaetidylserine decarboxylase [Steroidobacteraceae bacterium]|nr:archaetidylserine decarboxylase [Steroidobacteraceae bacterium]HRX89491.1 archaetidylserine decarboxylase [Steroidobacteraceae bacterium]
MSRQFDRIAPDASSPPPGLAARSFVLLQYLLPQHAVSRVVLAATRVRWRAFKNLLIGSFMRGFRPDMRDALESDPTAYGSFNAFFTRALRADARPIAPHADAIVSPVDGAVSQAGHIDGSTILQAKGHDYDLTTLLAGQRQWSERLQDGEFATIYLAPFDYHRIHMPLAGTLRAAWYVPGRLFSVNTVTVAAVPRLFARNERIVCCFETDGMPWSLVMVGALNVGSMTTVWHGDVAPRRSRVVTELPLTDPLAPLQLVKGAEIGRFNMGSTVILVLPRNVATWNAELLPGAKLRMGAMIGRLRTRAGTS